MTFSHHAQRRMRQRGVPERVVEWALEYGRPLRHHGADVFAFDHRSRRALRREIGPSEYERVKNRLAAYVVVGDDGTVLTVARRRTRLKKP
jgi:hypothetical protein